MRDGSHATISVSGERIVWARQLTGRHVDNCRVFPTREELISTMLVKAVCAEVGVQTGYFSAQILNRTTEKVAPIGPVDRPDSIRSVPGTTVGSRIGYRGAPRGKFGPDLIYFP